MKPVSPKRAARNAAVKPWRDALKANVGACELCRRRALPEYLCVHEIARGSGLRVKALDKGYAVLVLCRGPFPRRCHDEVQNWPEPKQLALLLLARGEDYHLANYLELTRPNAPKRITQAEVDRYADELLEQRS